MSSIETISRQWDILKRIPRHPHSLSTRQIFERLPSVEYDVSLRTVQRDLDSLSRKFPITCNLRGRTHYWSWMKEAPQLEIPRMSGSIATTMLLARDYLKPLLPRAALSELKIYFDHAEEVLKDTRLKGWPRKVRVLERGPDLTPPKIREAVREVVYQALLEGLQIRVRYRARVRQQTWSHVLNPLGLVIRAGVFYLVATVADYNDPRHFALHRMERAEMLDAPAVSPRGFSLDDHIDHKNSFAYPLSPRVIGLELLVHKDVAFHLNESKLSDDQTIKSCKDGRFRVTASVANTEQLRWWLRGFGDSVEVVRPAELI